ncbi:Mariner Mos1 transposase [Formica fusca]
MNNSNLKEQKTNVKFVVKLGKNGSEIHEMLCTVYRWILHQDNAPSHTALIVREFIGRNNITVMDHPPYSPDLGPCDFFLFPKIKIIMGVNISGTWRL